MQGVGIPAASPGSAAPSRQHTAEHAWRSTQGPSGTENSAKSGKYACCFPIHHMRWPSAQVCDAPLPWPWGCRQLAAAGPKRGCWWGGGGAVRGLHATRRPCACHGHTLRTHIQTHTWVLFLIHGALEPLRAGVCLAQRLHQLAAQGDVGVPGKPRRALKRAWRDEVPLQGRWRCSAAPRRHWVWVRVLSHADTAATPAPRQGGRAFPAIP